jgi:hypothetical protein
VARDGFRWWWRGAIGEETRLVRSGPTFMVASQASHGGPIPAGDLRHGRRVGWGRDGRSVALERGVYGEERPD